MVGSVLDWMKRGIVRKVGQKGYEILYDEDSLVTPGLGPSDDHWEDWRRQTLPNLHTIFKRFDGYAKYTLDQDEYAGTITKPAETVEDILWNNELMRNPLAALKTDPHGNTEVGSWMYRKQPTAERQVHVMVFAVETDGTKKTDLYAHEEYSAGHPDPEVAVKHYNAVDYDPDAGVEWVRENLPVNHRDRFE